jgi:hypothetical protein
MRSCKMKANALVAAIAIAAFYLGDPFVSVASTASSSDCAAIAQLIDGQVDVSTNGFIPLNESQDGLSAILQKTRTVCAKSDPHSHFVFSMLMVWIGWLAHYEHHDDSYVEQAIQLLTRCQTEYYGQHEGGVCALWQQKAIRWRLLWESNSSP